MMEKVIGSDDTLKVQGRRKGGEIVQLDDDTVDPGASAATDHTTVAKANSSIGHQP